MRARLVWSPDLGVRQRSGLGSKLGGAVVLFIVGAIAATQLYPQMFVGYATTPDSTRAVTAESAALHVVSDRSPETRPPSISSDARDEDSSVPPLAIESHQSPPVVQIQVPSDKEAWAPIVEQEKPRVSENKPMHKQTCQAPCCRERTDASAAALVLGCGERVE